MLQLIPKTKHVVRLEVRDEKPDDGKMLKPLVRKVKKVRVKKVIGGKKFLVVRELLPRFMVLLACGFKRGTSLHLPITCYRY